MVLLPSFIAAQDARMQPGGQLTKSKEISMNNEPEKIQDYQLYTIEKRSISNAAETPIVTLKNIKTTTLFNPIYDQRSVFPTEIKAKVFTSMERKQAIAYILVPQFIKSADGSIQKVVSFEMELEEKAAPQLKTTGTRVYANNSVLASGAWHKISISNTGLHKITFDFIKNNFGINPSTLNINNIRIYGNGGNMLAENNAIPRPDDLVENAIQIVDGGDGVLNSGDYILFYGIGPHAITKDSLNKRFSHRFNSFSDVATYFITFDLGAGKRVQTSNLVSNPNVTVTSYNYVYFYEKDSSNPGKFGKAWYGEEFSDQPGRFLNRTFNVNVEDIDATQPTYIRTRVGSVHYSGTSSFSLTANGQSIHSHSLASIGQSYADPTIRISDLTSSPVITSSPLAINFAYTKGAPSAAGFLDFLQVNCRRKLYFRGLLDFADWNSVGAGNIANYIIENANANVKIWDVTNPYEPHAMQTSLSGTQLSFNQTANQLRRFVAYDGIDAFIPNYIGQVANQNLHNSNNPDYIIVTNGTFKAQAEQLAQYHAQKRGYKTQVVLLDQIYNEFSSGIQDISAIRDYLKMLYDKAPINDIPDYVLFFGDASYDYKDRISNNTNIVPTYETNESISKITGYCTDDFFGFLDDNEDINNYSFNQINTLDIGIGRLVVTNTSQADQVLRKIYAYDSPQSFGPWKNNMAFNADDGDQAIHLEDGEIMSQYINDSLPVYNNYKIYVDAFTQQSTPAGPRSPDANKALSNQMYNGTFLVNYNGHGGPTSWCEERIFTMDDINALTNFNKLPLFITATCDFAPFDNPTKVSAGETLLLKPDGGAIALMTTTQLVYADQNRIMNLNYMKQGFKPQGGKYPTLGDAFRLSKNLRYISSIDEFAASNFRKFALLGDPALPLSFPKHQVKTDSVNGVSIQVKFDTLKALGKYTISGHVEDGNGNFLSNYNGIVYPTIFDKPKKQRTLSNDGDSPARDFYTQNSVIFKGKATVRDGKFSFTFVVPKDIDYTIGKGKISYYIANDTEDGAGYDKDIHVGSVATNVAEDNQGPTIKAYMNNENFANGGIVNKNSTLLVKLFDDNGINYTGSSVGHDITAILDNNAQQTYVLNNYFESDLDDARSGSIRFPMNNLSLGEHTLTVKAWDIHNNSSEATIQFVVVDGTDGKIANIYNHPNPFTTKTQFMFEHNMPYQNLYVSINIYTSTGKTVKTIKTMVNSDGNRVSGLEWDGTDQYGDRLGNGVYLYKLSVKSAAGFSDHALQKLVILR